MTDDEFATPVEQRFRNPYLAATMLAGGAKRADALRQFAASEAEDAFERMRELENDDGSIPPDNEAAWEREKAKMDTHRLYHGMAVSMLLADRGRGDADSE